MRYTGPLGLEINGVPVSMFLCTHPYFMTYVLVSPFLRTAKANLKDYKLKTWLFAAVVVCIAFLTVFMETWTISGFPYYTYPDFYSMLTKGSLLYGTFFVVTYPWFFQIDEDVGSLWSVKRVVLEALASMMVVLLCADVIKLILIGSN